MQFFQRILDWFKSLFWKEEMELTLVGLQYSGKTTFVNVIAVSETMVQLKTIEWISVKTAQNSPIFFIQTFMLKCRLLNLSDI